MPDREATCLCGQLRLGVTGDPLAVSICNCLACKRGTGSAFGMQAGFTSDQVRIEGRYRDYSRVSDEADRKEHVLHFCPECGCVAFWRGRAVDEQGRRRIAVNLRLAEPGPIADVVIDHFDGLDSFDDLPRDGRCIKDMWF